MTEGASSWRKKSSNSALQHEKGRHLPMTSSSSREKLAAANYGLPFSQKRVYHLLRESSRLAELLHLQHFSHNGKPFESFADDFVQLFYFLHLHVQFLSVYLLLAVFLCAMTLFLHPHVLVQQTDLIVMFVYP